MRGESDEAARRWTLPTGLGLDFLIVGTPRSGTTLLQRLACELPGVSVPPETHFFSLFLPGLLRRHRFPLEEANLVEELRHYAALDRVREHGIDPLQVADALGGRCERPIDLFVSVVQALAGPAPVYGEKTPDHLLWWRPLARALPEVKVIAVIRDPRAVVASNLGLPWGMSHPDVLAERWGSDQRQVLAAAAALGRRRCLVLRYEAMVQHPEEVQRSMAELLGLGVPAGGTDPLPAHRQSPLYRPSETWKARVDEPITRQRIEAWRTSSGADAKDVAAICRREMLACGYHDDLPTPAEAFRRRMRANPSMQFRRLKFRLARSRRLRRIDRTAL